MTSPVRTAAVLAMAVSILAGAPGPHRAAAANDATFVAAAQAGDLGRLDALLRRDPAVVNQTGPDGTTALHHAVNRDDLPMVEALIEAGADVAARNRYGFPPATLAAVNGNATIMRRLLAAGADPNASVPGGETVLLTAARTGSRDTLEALLAAGARPDAANVAGQTALMWAAAANNPGAIEVLAAHGADLHTRTEGGLDALAFAVRAGRSAAAETLLDAGADVDGTLAGGESVLEVALVNTRWDLANLLLDRGANPNAGNAGYTALHRIAVLRAIVRGVVRSDDIPVPIGAVDVMLDLVRKMIAGGLDVNARMTKDALKDQRFINRQDVLVRVGATGFLLAAKEADLELMRVLLDAGADPTIPTFDGTTPLMVAAGLYSQRGSFERFEERGQEDDLLRAVRMCLELGNDVNATNDLGDSALHGAAYRGAPAVARFLIAHGARLDAVDTRGLLPLAVASGVYYKTSLWESPETAAVLRRAMEDRGLPTAVPEPDLTNRCLYCYLTNRDQYRAAREHIRALEEAFEEQRKASHE